MLSKYLYNDIHILYRDDCFDIPKILCSNKGANVYSPLSKDNKLITWLKFDENIPYDSSGNNNEISGEVGVGPSSHIKGYSAFFNGEQMLTIKNTDVLNQATDISITFWIYLLEDSNGNWRTIINKGSNIQELTPTIMLWPKERRLHIRASTEMFWNEGIESKAIINLRQWTHIAVVISGQMIQLFVNGSLDNQLILKGKIKANTGDLHVGKDLWHPGVKCFMDDLKVYNKALRSKEIEAEAAISNPLSGGSYVTLGCESCSFIQALSSCNEGYHMCSYNELYAGGYLAARRNGWFKYTTDVWARESKEELEKNSKVNEIGDPNIVKMALCCSDK